jgi:prepilin-type N-terminal cleavage/methylation domain-containing protein
MKKRFRTAAVKSRCRAFTLIELLISLAVTAMIILMVAQLMSSTTAVTRTGNKHIDTDTQARAILDRMAIDFAKMLKRTDVDYYLKGLVSYKAHGNGHGYGQGKVAKDQLGSDQIAFFSQVPGYYPATAFQSPLSLVAYRVNNDSTSASYLQLERMGKGLLWNGVSNSIPIVFLPLTIAATWPAATNDFAQGQGPASASQDSSYETIGPHVFRFEYFYLIKNGRLSASPWNTDAGHTTINGLTDVQAIGVTIAVIDRAGRAIINAANPSSLFDLASDLTDFTTTPGRGVGQQNKYIGGIEAQWNGVLFGDASRGLPGVVNTGMTSNNTPVPPEAAKGIRLYTRYFDLRTF